MDKYGVIAFIGLFMLWIAGCVVGIIACIAEKIGEHRGVQEKKKAVDDGDK